MKSKSFQLEFLNIDNLRDYINKQSNGTIKLEESFPEYKLFAILFMKYGYPNSKTNVRGGDPNALIKWAYVAKISKSTYLEITRTSSSLEVAQYGSFIKSEKIINFFYEQIEKYKTQIKMFTDSKLESYDLILNPYEKHRKMANTAFNILCDTNENTQINFYSSILLTESVMSVDSLISLLFTIFAKEENRSKEKLDDFKSKPWDLKLTSLFDFCLCFDKEVNIESDLLNRLVKHYIYKNRIVYSDFDNEHLIFEHIYFMQRIPILEKAQEYEQNILEFTNQFPTKNDALDTYNDCVEIVEIISNNVCEQYKVIFELFKNNRVLGWNKTNQLYSIPFDTMQNKN